MTRIQPVEGDVLLNAFLFGLVVMNAYVLAPHNIKSIERASMKQGREMARSRKGHKLYFKCMQCHVYDGYISRNEVVFNFSSVMKRDYCIRIWVSHEALKLGDHSSPRQKYLKNSLRPLKPYTHWQGTEYFGMECGCWCILWDTPKMHGGP